jgi:hypothetical protein
VSDILFYDLGKLEDALAQRDALVNTLKGIAEFCSSDARSRFRKPATSCSRDDQGFDLAPGSRPRERRDLQGRPPAIYDAAQRQRNE